ncbi:uncharacterized protein LOC121737665 [Aricia agestis]|uniref:uncharacterized protein LOC121737665 n=1 Tax=Aricia agestis TaxID=91739 RepID=UPI001C204ED6|nr:uncharacterized protein LOC121737665 [Aricia agestis]
MVINTFVFMDIETTGLPSEECNKTRITEISMIAAQRDHLLDTRPGATPRVQHKITFCLNPGRLIYPSCSEVTGLCNDLLEHAPNFNQDIFRMLDTFLNVLEKPVCLVAQNGNQFDYPILKNHLVKIGVSFSEDLLCADSFFAFYHIFENKKKENSITDKVVIEKEKESDLSPDEIKLSNESTPKRLPANEDVHTPVKERKDSLKTKKCSARRRFPWSCGSRPIESYKLKNIHERLLNRPSVEAHRAENDCIMLMECVVACGEQMLKYMDSNHQKFFDIKPMEIGVRIGA